MKSNRCSYRKSFLFAASMMAVCSSLSLVSCDTAGQGAVTGALGGAALGGVIGNQSGEAGKGALLGGLGGAVVGGAVGNENQKKRQASYPQYDNRYAPPANHYQAPQQYRNY